jgi:hypothetical protein
MNCPPIQTILDYLIGEISGEERIHLESHLLDCPNCQRILAEEQILETTLRTLPALKAPQGFASGVMERISAVPARQSWPDWIWALGIGLLMTFIGLMGNKYGVSILKPAAALFNRLIEKTGLIAEFNEVQNGIPHNWFSMVTSGNNLIAINLTVAGVILSWALWQVVRALRN